MDYAGTIDAVGRLPFILQIFFIVVAGISFACVLLFGFGKRWKGVIKLAKEVQDRSGEITDGLTAFEIKSKTDEVDSDCRMRIFRTTRSKLFIIISKIEKTCPLFAYNLRLEGEAEIRNYIFENHLVKKSFAKNRESEKDRLRQSAREIYDGIIVSFFSTKCEKYETAPAWQDIELAVYRFIDEFIELLKTEIRGACAEKLVIYEYYALTIKAQSVRRVLVDKPTAKNQEYIRKIDGV